MALLVGAGLARRRAYRAHGLCQAVAFGGTFVLAVVWMVPALRL